MDARRLTSHGPRAGGRGVQGPLALVLSVLVLAGCGAGRDAPRSPTASTTARTSAAPTATPAPGDSTAPDELPDELRLEATSGYGRHAAVRAKADLRLANRGREPVRITALQVRHPLFGQLPATSRRSVLPPDGDARLVPVPLGPPQCDRQDPSGAVLVLAVQTQDGVQEVQLPLVDREPGLVRAHRLACARAAVERLVAVELRTDGTRVDTASGTGLAATLHLQRRAPGAVTVTELTGSILFSVAGTPPAPLLVLPDTADEAQAGVVLLASRCDQHALIESKTSFTFPLFARIEDGEPARLTTTAGGPARDALQALLDDTCRGQQVSTSP